MPRSRLILTLFIVLTGVAQAQTPRRPAGDPVGVAVRRVLIGLDANPKTASDYRQADWAESIALMRTTSANHLHYAKVWSEIEPRPNAYNTDDVRFMVQQSSPLAIAFNLRVVDAGARNMPDEYKRLEW